MRPTTIYEKTLTSVINVIMVFIIYAPFDLILSDIFVKKIVIIGIFFLFNMAFVIFKKGRCLGMMILHTHYAAEYSTKKQLLYISLYTASFATLFFWIYFPFDLFLFNMIMIQLPTIRMTGTTFHGYISGNVATVIQK